MDNEQSLSEEESQNLIKEDIASQFCSEIKVKGKAHPVKTYKVLAKISKKVEQDIVNVSQEGFALTIDKNKIKNKDEILTILEDSIDKLST